MIARKHRTRSFVSLARYLETGAGPSRERRVLWSEGHNLPTDEPITAALIMRFTAERNARVEQPGLHLSLSFAPSDPVNQQIAREIAARFLDWLSLNEYQVLIVAHGDRQHPHLHLMVNRVHPENGRAWDMPFDYRLTQAFERRMEREYGLRLVAGRLHRESGLVIPETGRLSIGERRAPRDGIHTPLLFRARSLLSALRSASGWPDLNWRLAERGLQLEPRRGGFVFTDGINDVKASRVAPDMSRRALERRLGPWMSPASNAAVGSGTITIEVRELIELIKSYERSDVRRATEARAHIAAAVTRDAASSHQAVHRSSVRLWAAFDVALRQLYGDTATAERVRTEFVEMSRSEGPQRAAMSLEHTPEKFGFALRPGSLPSRWFGGKTARSVRERAAESAALGQAAIEAEQAVTNLFLIGQARENRMHLQHAFELLYAVPADAYSAFVDMRSSHGTARAVGLLEAAPECFGSLTAVGIDPDERAKITRELANLAALGPELGSEGVTTDDAPSSSTVNRRRHAERLLVSALNHLYLDPRSAYDALSASVATKGVVASARAMREIPETYGPLRDAAQPERRARDAARLVYRVFDAPLLGRVSNQSSNVADDKEQQQPQRRPHSALAREISERLRRLTAAESRVLDTLLTAAQCTLTNQVRRAAREALIGREDSRER